MNNIKKFFNKYKPDFENSLWFYALFYKSLIKIVKLEFLIIVIFKIRLFELNFTIDQLEFFEKEFLFIDNELKSEIDKIYDAKTKTWEFKLFYSIYKIITLFEFK